MDTWQRRKKHIEILSGVILKALESGEPTFSPRALAEWLISQGKDGLGLAHLEEFYAIEENLITSSELSSAAEADGVTKELERARIDLA